MRTWDIRDSVPTDESTLRIFRILCQDTIYVFHALGEQMDPPAILRREPFDLLDDAKLSTMATIKKRGDNNNLQAGLLLRKVFTRLIARQEDFLEIPKLGTECQASAKNRRS